MVVEIHQADANDEKANGKENAIAPEPFMINNIEHDPGTPPYENYPDDDV